MKERLLDYLVCPACRGKMTCIADETSESTYQRLVDIITGKLACKCGNVYPIVRGIPRMTIGVSSKIKEHTSKNFGWEWCCFKSLAHDLPNSRTQFLEWVKPLHPEYFKGKIVVDAGCGMGRWSMVVSELGAKEVLAFDLSDSVEAARENLISYPNVHVIQADIYSLPFRRDQQAQVDSIYSIGVLHHLPDPEDGFQCLARLLRAGGGIFSWVYGRENNEWIVRYINPIRKHVTARLPSVVLYWLSFALACLLQPVLKVAYKNNRYYRTERLPYYPYLSWLAKYGFKHTHHVIHDHLTAPLAEYVTRDDYQRWFSNAGLVNVILIQRNANSWSGYGEKPFINNHESS